MGVDCSGAYGTIKEITRDEEHLSKGVEAFLKELMPHARREVPNYRAILKGLAHLEGDAVDLAMFRDLPLLTRVVVGSHFRDLMSGDFGRRSTYLDPTSGSTGELLKVLIDR